MARKAKSTKSSNAEHVAPVVMLADAPEGKKGAIAMEVTADRIAAMVKGGFARPATARDLQVAGLFTKPE